LNWNRQVDFAPGGDLPKCIIGLLIANAVCFLLTQIHGFDAFAYNFLYLRTDTFMPWQLLTYPFFHGSASHLFFNMLGLFFVGPAVTREFHGEANFMKFYMACAVGAGVISYPLGFFTDMGPILGASGAIYGLFYACYRFFPDAIVHVWFVLPIKLKHMLLLMIVISFVMMFDGSSGVAHVAHLGGLLTGWCWFRYADSFQILAASWERKKEERQLSQDQNMSSEVDRILEKISKVGMGELTTKERALLKRASKRFKDK
jgi:membrane associated rhomboid family serine protease